MTGDNRVRHCQECKLNVYNLSEMTRSEAERLIAGREGRLCVRFYRRADGTILTRDCPWGFRVMVRRVSRVAGAAFSAMIAVGTVVAQSVPKVRPKPANGQTQPQDAQLTFTVVDQSDALVAGAKFSLTDSSGKVHFAGATNSNGVGRVSGVAPGDFVLRIEFPGFTTYVAPITINAGKTQPLRIVLSIAIMGEVVQVAPTVEPSIQTSVTSDFLSRLPLR
jgi:hypothetical protein